MKTSVAIILLVMASGYAQTPDLVIHQSDIRMHARMAACGRAHAPDVCRVQFESGIYHLIRPIIVPSYVAIDVNNSLIVAEFGPAVLFRGSYSSLRNGNFEFNIKGSGDGEWHDIPDFNKDALCPGRGAEYLLRTNKWRCKP